jgi:hypothetical protein
MRDVYPKEMILHIKRFYAIARESIDKVNLAFLNLDIEQKLMQ